MDTTLHIHDNTNMHIAAYNPGKNLTLDGVFVLTLHYQLCNIALGTQSHF